MAAVALRGVHKSFGSTAVVHGVDLGIKDGEFCVLVGPSGCGKSTLLRMIAGLEEISGGEIDIGGRVVNNLAPKERDIAMVFQNYALYPHMTVRDNMSFALMLAKTPKDEIDRNTYSLFDLEDGVPTDAYNLDEAVTDGFLVPPRAVSLTTDFLDRGIRYDQLSDDEKEAWDALEWDEDGTVPGAIDAPSINNWLFNADTVDRVLNRRLGASAASRQRSA